MRASEFIAEYEDALRERDRAYGEWFSAHARCTLLAEGLEKLLNQRNGKPLMMSDRIAMLRDGCLAILPADMAIGVDVEPAADSSREEP